MSKLIDVVAQDDYTLLIEFEHGNEIKFNMQRLVKTLAYSSLSDIERFKEVKFKDKAIYWKTPDDSRSSLMHPLEITVDNILFTIRD